MSSRSREEVLNVKLAETLNDLGILSVPESIVRTGSDIRLPDVTVGEFKGLKVVIEGKVDERKSSRNQLAIDCVGRLDDMLADMVFGVLYPPKLRTTPFRNLKEAIKNSTLTIRTFTEAGSSDWHSTDVYGLSDMISRAYSAMINEDVVNEAVEILTDTIETVAQNLSSFSATAKRLEKMLLEPPEQNEGGNR